MRHFALDSVANSRIISLPTIRFRPMSVPRISRHCMKDDPMPLGLIGTKVGMTQVYNEKGEMSPVTVLQIGPCPILQIRTVDNDGYDALQLGYMDKARRKATRGERGHVSADMESKRRSTPG